MEIINRWKYKGKNVVSKWFTSNNYKEFDPITQVYGVCFTKEGKILIVKDLSDWKLPGGTPEINEKPEKTLKREVLEEANIVLGKCSMIGAQEVLFPNNPNKEQGEKFYQLRYIGIIEDIKEQKIDPATGRLMKRKFVKPSEFKKYVRWGNIGKEMLKEALKKFKNKKIFRFLD